MGKLFVIDGTDGSGKQTQSSLLKERLQKDGIDFKSISFPNYDSPSSALVKMYLEGDFGENQKDVSPYIASTFYAADRYATFKKDFEKYYNNGGIIIADRYTTSNMIHQAGIIKDKQEREKFLKWLWDFEFNLYGLPIPTEVIFLNMPPDYTEKLIQDRENKITHEKQKDIIEKNKQNTIDAYNNALELVKKYNWYEIKCVKADKIRTIEDINGEIYELVKKKINS